LKALRDNLASPRISGARNLVIKQYEAVLFAKILDIKKGKLFLNRPQGKDDRKKK
jgi:hypothetical protein